MRKFNTVQEIRDERKLVKDNKVINTLLGTLLGELDRLPTRDEPTSEQIYTVVKKLYESSEVMREYNPGADQEYMYLKDFIRVQLTDEQLTSVVSEYVTANPGAKMGDVMKMLKETYPAQYDGKAASKITMSVLQNK